MFLSYVNSYSNFVESLKDSESGVGYFCSIYLISQEL